MAMISSVLFSVLVLQAFSTASLNENNVATPRNHATLDSIPNDVLGQRDIENESSNNKRQKRFYDYIDFKYPPFYPAGFPYPGQSHYSKRDESSHIGTYGADEAFTQIFRRLRDILADAKQYAQPPQSHPTPPVTHFTGYIPLIYIPPAGCTCTAHHNNHDATTPVNLQPPAVTGDKRPLPSDQTTPSLSDRFPEIDDKRQNWGILINGTGSNPEVEGDGNRPISFVPVVPEEAIDVPVPPVEHGSVQAGLKPEQLATTTLRAIIAPGAPAPPSTFRPNKDSRVPFPSNRPSSRAPTTCDTAVIACCVQSQIAPNCFEKQGCADTSIYGNPCAPDVVLNVINKVQFYIKQRNT